jgi:hypothetical protein
VALHAAALDDALAGVVAVAAFMPRRANTADRQMGGVDRWSSWFPALPKLRVFSGREAHVPYDYHEVLAMIAPRPVVVATPGLDAWSRAGDVRDCVEEARVVYDRLGRKDQLTFLLVDDYNRWTPELQRALLQRLDSMPGLVGTPATR